MLSGAFQNFSGEESTAADSGSTRKLEVNKIIIINNLQTKMDGDTATKVTTSLGDINNNKEVTTKDAIDKISLVMAIADKLPDEDTNEFSELVSHY